MKLEVNDFGELGRMFVSYVQRFKKKRKKKNNKAQTKPSQSVVVVAITEWLYSERGLGSFVENH